MKSRVARLVTAGLLSAVLAVTGTLAMSCGGKLPPATPSAQLAQYEATASAALQAVADIAKVANASINPSTGQPFLSTSDTNAVVSGISTVEKILAAAQTGWPTALVTGWSTFKASLNAAQTSQLAVVIAAGDVAVAAVVAAAGGSQPLPAQSVHDVVDVMDRVAYSAYPSPKPTFQLRPLAGY